MKTDKKTFVTIREFAAMGILSEHAIRILCKQGKLPVVYSGSRAYINADKAIEQLNSL